MSIKTTGPAKERINEVGFLLLLLLMVVLQFVIFYFWLPAVTSSLPKSDEAGIEQNTV